MGLRGHGRTGEEGKKEGQPEEEILAGSWRVARKAAAEPSEAVYWGVEQEQPVDGGRSLLEGEADPERGTELGLKLLAGKAESWRKNGRRWPAPTWSTPAIASRTRRTRPGRPWPWGTRS